MFSNASRICCVGIWRRFSHLRLPLKWPNWISSVSMAPKRVSNLKLEISSRLTPMSLRQSSKRPTQSEKVPIFATLPGMDSPITRPKSSPPGGNRIHEERVVSSLVLRAIYKQDSPQEDVLLADTKPRDRTGRRIFGNPLARQLLTLQLN